MTNSDRKLVFGQPVAPVSPSARVRAVNREQMLMLQIDVERLIPEDHAARAIWELTGKLELKAFYEQVKAVEGRAGQPPFDPRLMISIWVYGLSRGINSARELSEWCRWEPGLQWLCAMGSVNYHSLSTFRSLHREALKQLFIELLGVLTAEGLVGLERLAVDGTRIRAHCSNAEGRKGQRLQDYLKKASAHLEELEREPEESLQAREQAARERSRRERQQRVTAARSVFEKLQQERGEKDAAEVQMNVNEPEARVMKQPEGNFAPGYNLQLATDARAKIIVAAVTSDRGADIGLLGEVMDAVKETSGKLPKEVLVDGGYVSANNLEQSGTRGVELIGPVPETGGSARKQAEQRGVSEAYRKEAFHYDSQNDTYQCPEGKLLVHIRAREREAGRIEHYYRAKRGDCARCGHKTECCPTAWNQGRTVTRTEPSPLMSAYREKMQTEGYRQLYRTRSEVAEFPNAWIKEKLRLRRFRLSGIAKVAAESLWAVITYNAQQWIRLSWRPQLTAANVA
jgi:transposase